MKDFMREPARTQAVRLMKDLMREPAKIQAVRLCLFDALLRRLCYLLAQKGNPEIY